MIKRRDGTTVHEPNAQDQFLQKMYQSCLGRSIMKVLSIPFFSKFSGWVLTKSISKICIDPFIRENKIDMSQYESVEYNSFDEFFSRNKKAEFRQVEICDHQLISPCDSKLLVYPISGKAHFYIKQSFYTLATLLRDKNLAQKYEEGYALVFRLTVDNYHRYCYVDNGIQEEIIHIPGFLHSVNPVVNDYLPVYKENSREYCICHTSSFGTVVAMEVGALMIGQIINHQKSGPFCKGQEKGYFRFGGSTIILLFQKNTIKIDRDIIHNSLFGIETEVRYGEKIGEALMRQ